MPADPNRRHHAVPVQQAAEEAPTLARLATLARQSQAHLDAVLPLLPPELRAAVQAGPVDGSSWCLLVHGSAAAAKLRQLLPRLLAGLQAQGAGIDHIRLKVAGARR